MYNSLIFLPYAFFSSKQFLSNKVFCPMNSFFAKLTVGFKHFQHKKKKKNTQNHSVPTCSANLPKCRLTKLSASNGNVWLPWKKKVVANNLHLAINEILLSIAQQLVLFTIGLFERCEIQHWKSNIHDLFSKVQQPFFYLQKKTFLINIMCLILKC